MMRLLPPAAPAWEPTENCTDTVMEINEQRLSEEGESLIRLEMDCNNMLLACVNVWNWALLEFNEWIASVAQDTIKEASYRDARTKQSSYELHNNQQIVWKPTI